MHVFTWRAQVSGQLHEDKKLFNNDKLSSFSELVSSLCDCGGITELCYLFFLSAVDAPTGQESTWH